MSVARVTDFFDVHTVDEARCNVPRGPPAQHVIGSVGRTLRTTAKVWIELRSPAGDWTLVQALIDTGAEVTVIRSDKLPVGTVEVATGTTLTGAFDNRADSLTKVEVPSRHNGLRYGNLFAFVAPSMQHEVVLGLDWLRQNKMLWGLAVVEADEQLSMLGFRPDGTSERGVWEYKRTRLSSPSISVIDLVRAAQRSVMKPVCLPTAPSDGACKPASADSTERHTDRCDLYDLDAAVVAGVKFETGEGSSLNN